MTQYLLSVNHAGNGPDISEEEMQQSFKDVDALNQRLMAEGQWVFGGGLEPVETATVVRDRDGEALITDGPYIEAKEHIGGFWIVELPDLDAALALAHEASIACRNPVEVRPFQSE